MGELLLHLSHFLSSQRLGVDGSLQSKIDQKPGRVDGNGDKPGDFEKKVGGAQKAAVYVMRCT